MQTENLPAIPTESLNLYQSGREAVTKQRYNDAVDLLNQCLSSIPQDSQYDEFLARTHQARGEAYWFLADYDAAETDFKTALDISQTPTYQALALIGLGDVADYQGNYEAASAFYSDALKRAINTGSLRAVGLAYRGLGIVNRRQGNAEMALSHLTQALAVFRQSGNAREQARVLTSIGRVRYARGEYQQAISAHSESLKILESLKDRWRTVLALNDLGECYRALYDLSTATTYHTRALGLVEAYEADVIKPDIQRNLGVDLISSGFLEEGLAYLNQALRNAQKLGNREQEALILYSLARAQRENGDLDHAISTVNRLEQVADELDADRYRALAFWRRAETLFAQDKREEAIPHIQNAMLAAQTALDRGLLWKLHAALGQMVADEAIAQVHLNIAADFIRQTAEPLQDPNLKTRFLNAAPVLAILSAANIDPSKI
ncbi:MAG TPA: tetratricopeptide repeat protein [Anaerolineae bacterium]|nr:tetratricopeptide repeat protein [Anaerolineae bacterium]